MNINDAKMKFGEMQNDSSNKATSLYTKSYKGEYYNIDTYKLIPYSNQARQIFDEESLKEMASSIQKQGIIQPLIVTPSNNISNRYEILSGERRWRAAKILNLKQVACIIKNNVDNVDAIALIENIHRKNLHPLELAKVFSKLIKNKVYKNITDLAENISMQRTFVSELISFASIPINTQKTLVEKGIQTRDILRKLSKEPVEKHKKILQNYLGGKKSANSSQKKQSGRLLLIQVDTNKIRIEENGINELTDIKKQELKIHLQKIINKIQSN